MMRNQPQNVLKAGDFNMEEFEVYLSNALVQVEPRSEYVSGVRDKLVNTYSKTTRRRKALRYGVFGTAGVISSLILLATSIRATITLLGAIRILRHNVPSEQTAP